MNATMKTLIMIAMKDCPPGSDKEKALDRLYAILVVEPIQRAWRNRQPFDITYANECIDRIMQNVTHPSIHRDISNYYRYLRSKYIDPQESYLTKWLDYPDTIAFMEE